MTCPTHRAAEDWHGEWLSLADMARLFGKSLPTISKLCRTGPNLCSGICIVRAGRRVWARVDRSLLPTLLL